MRINTPQTYTQKKGRIAAAQVAEGGYSTRLFQDPMCPTPRYVDPLGRSAPADSLYLGSGGCYPSTRPLDRMLVEQSQRPVVASSTYLSPWIGNEPLRGDVFVDTHGCEEGSPYLFEDPYTEWHIQQRNKQRHAIIDHVQRMKALAGTL